MSDVKNKQDHVLKKRARAFGVAFSGFWQAFKTQVHLKLHLLAAGIVVAAGWYYKVSRTEWMLLIVCMALVISLELINSSVERVCDALVNERSQDVKFIKDVAAAAVLIASVAALAVGLIIFLPHIQAG